MLCHPLLVLPYLQAFDTANVWIGVERKPQRTEDIYYVTDPGVAPPE